MEETQKWVGGLSTKPSWDTYFMTLAFLTAQRSIDESCAHGAIIVSKDKRILSTGYNSPIQGSIDEEVPQIRPDKYAVFVHAEENAILNYFGSKEDIKGATIYITGEPCHKCFRMALSKGITSFVYGGVTASMIDEFEVKAKKMIANGHCLERMDQVDLKQEINSLLLKTKTYLNERG